MIYEQSQLFAGEKSPLVDPVGAVNYGVGQAEVFISFKYGNGLLQRGGPEGSRTPEPLLCHSSALPTELRARIQ